MGQVAASHDRVRVPGVPLVDELTAVENVELPALLVGTSRRAARRRATELLDRLGVVDRAGHFPTGSPVASASGWRWPGRWSTSP